MLFLDRKLKETSLQHQNNQGSFTPLAFTVAVVMRGEDRASYSLLATLMPLKNGIENSKVRSWIRLVNFALPRSMSLCLRGLRQNSVNEKLDTELEPTNIKNI